MCNEGNGAGCPLCEMQLHAVHSNPDYWSMQIWTRQLALCAVLFARSEASWDNWDTKKLGG